MSFLDRMKAQVAAGVNTNTNKAAASDAAVSSSAVSSSAVSSSAVSSSAVSSSDASYCSGDVCSSSVSEEIMSKAEVDAPVADVSDFMSVASVTAHVTCDVLNIRSTPSTKEARVGTLKRGAAINVIGLCDEWLKIDIDGEVRYVCAQFTDYDAPSFTVTASKLNIRKGPGTDFDRIGQLDNGDVVRGLGETKGWVKILHKDKIGYLSKDYLK